VLPKTTCYAGGQRRPARHRCRRQRSNQPPAPFRSGMSGRRAADAAPWGWTGCCWSRGLQRLRSYGAVQRGAVSTERTQIGVCGVREPAAGPGQRQSVRRGRRTRHARRVCSPKRPATPEASAVRRGIVVTDGGPKRRPAPSRSGIRRAPSRRCRPEWGWEVVVGRGGYKDSAPPERTPRRGQDNESWTRRPFAGGSDAGRLACGGS
jgi:hypothetical protein